MQLKVGLIMPTKNELESKICPYCDKPSLKIFTDITGYRWVVCLDGSGCKFEAFLDEGDSNGS